MIVQSVLILVLGLSSVEFGGQSISRESIAGVASSSQWKRLLHYEHRLPFGSLKSLFDGKGFFLAKDGKFDPEGELVSTILAFDPANLQKIGRFKVHPQCAFPARLEFVEASFGIKIKRVPCPELEAYLLQFEKAENISFVFSSAYPNNPGSMFGHNFLKINTKPEGRASELLDYGVNYAAVVGPDENSLRFILFGLLGGYRGQFSLLPYHMKVQEYNNQESRDIWEYVLNFNHEETVYLLKHLWELETNSWAGYFFFTENCAYHLLAALEVAKPKWTLTNFIFQVTPAAAVKKLVHQSGAVREVKFRPSKKKEFQASLDILTPLEKSEFSLLSENPGADLGSVNQPYVLDALISYLDFKKTKEKGQLNADDSKWFRKVLVRRSKLDYREERARPLISENSRPDIGHDDSRISLGAGYFKHTASKGSQIDLEYRIAYHDLLDSDLGYTRFSEINFPRIKLRIYPEAPSLHLEEAEIVGLRSLFPIENFDRRYSYRFLIDVYTPRDFGRLESNAFRGEAGGGLSFALNKESLWFYLLGVINTEWGKAFDPVRFQPYPEVGILGNFHDLVKFHLQGKWINDLFQSRRQSQYYRFESDFSLRLARNHSLRGFWRWDIAENFRRQTYRELGANYAFYF